MVQKIINKIKEVVCYKQRLTKSLAVANTLINQQNDLLKAIGKAINNSLQQQLTTQQQQVFAAIEKRRMALQNDDSLIVVKDYGAGNATDNRTAEQMQVGVEVKQKVSEISWSSKPPFWAALLHNIVKQIQPQTVVELGTCLGVSATYMATALQGNHQKIITLEGAEAIAGMAQQTFNQLGVSNKIEIVKGAFANTLPAVLHQHQPIDFLFNDGHHSYQAVIDYFNQSLPYLSSNAVMIIDDISWSKGMQQAWQQLTKHASVAASIDLKYIGILVLNSSQRTTAVHYKLPMPLKMI